MLLPIKFTFENHVIRQPFYLGQWQVSPVMNQLKNVEMETYIEPKLMQVLVYLCLHAPNVISSHKLIETCWKGQYVSDNPLHKCIAQLRKILGDSAKSPKFIKTIPKKGYSIIPEIKGIHLQNADVKVTWPDHTPYMGLKPYDSEHQKVFFGRTKAITEIKSLIDKNIKKQWPFMILEGAASVGKTSIIHASIIPFLESPNTPFSYQFNAHTTYDFALNNNKSHFSAFIQFLTKKNILNAWLDVKKYRSELQSSLESTESINDTLFALTNKNPSKNKQIIFLDHFEEVIGSDESESESNLILLAIIQLLKTQEFFIITCIRSEHFLELRQSDAFKKISKNLMHYKLLPPDDFEIIEIVQKPVLAAGLNFEYDKSKFESLDKTIIDEAKNMDSVLPILSHTLKELCEQHNDSFLLTYENYAKFGKLTGALNYKIEHILEELSDKQKYLFEQNLHFFIQYRPAQSKQYIVSETNLNSIGNITFINQLISKGLLQAKVRNNETYVSLLHDSVLNACVFFKNWIKNNHLKLSLMTEINTLSKQWYANDKSNDYLLNNKYLITQIVPLIKGRNTIFSSQQNQFLKSSLQKFNLNSKIKFLFMSMLVMLLILSVSVLIINKETNNNLIQTNNNAEKLINFMMGDLNKKLLPLGKLELLENIGDQVIDYYDNQTLKTQSDQSQLQYIRALSIIGEADVNQGKLASAEKHFQLSINKDITTFKNTTFKADILFSYAQSYYWLGYINYIQNNFELTESYWYKYLAVCDTLLQTDPQDDLKKLEKSYAMNNLGSLYFKQKELLKAEKYFNGSARLKREIVSNNPNRAQYIADLADTISWQANILDKKNQLQLSNQLYSDSLELTQKLILADPKNKIWQHRLALAYYRVTLSHYDLGQLDNAETNIGKALSLYNKLHQFDPSNQNWLKELINCHLLLSKIYKNKGLLDSALLHINKGKNLMSDYSPGSSTLRSTNVQNLYLNAENSMILMALGQSQSALEQFILTVKTFKKQNISKYKNANYYRAYMNFILAQIHSKNKHNEESITLLNEALSLINDKHIKTMDKKYIALYIAIKKALDLNHEAQKLITFLNDIHYKNPDFINNNR